MINMVNKISRKNEISFLENVCSCRTNLELLQIPRKQDLCNRDMEYHD